MQKISTLIGVLILIFAIIILFGGAFTFQYLALQRLQVLMAQAQQVSNIQKANQTAGWQIYTNNEYGFEIKFPNSWKGYSVVVQNWEGHLINNYQQTYSGPQIIFKNPQTTPTQPWQDIPVMVFTPDVWKMVNGPDATVAVSAAPIGPEKIGENSKYIFATPPRWYGFTDAIGYQEAVQIVKTFKAF